MNRFNQITDQKYVPLPFQDILGTADIVQKRGDANRAAFDKEAELAHGLKAIPGSQDEAALKDWQNKVDALTLTYSTDPKLYTNPNAIYNLKSELKKITDPVLINNIGASAKSYYEDIQNQQELAKAGKLRKELIPSATGWDSRNGVYNGATPGYEPSTVTTSPWIDNFKGHQEYDQATGQTYSYIDENDLQHFADTHAFDYVGTPSFNNEVRIKLGVDASQLSDTQKIAFAKQTLLNDFQERRNDIRKGSSTGDRGSGSRGTKPDYMPAVDVGFTLLHAQPSAKLTPQQMSVILPNKNEDGTFDVPINAGEGVMQFAGDAANNDPKMSLATSLLKRYEGIVAKGVGLAPSGQMSAMTEGLVGGSIVTKNKLSDEDLKAKDEALKQIQDLGFTFNDLKPNGKVYQALHAKTTEADVQKAIDSLGQSFDLGGGIGKFVPTMASDNYVRVKTANGTTEAYIPGQLIYTPEQMDNAMRAGGMGSMYNMTDPLTNGWDDVLESSPEMQNLIKKTADGNYAIKYFKKVQTDDNTADAVNKASSMTDEEITKSRPYWTQSRSDYRARVEGKPTSGESDFADKIKQIESHGDYKIKSDSSSASGAYQATDSTWGNFGGYKHAADAPPEIQDKWFHTEQLPKLGKAANNLRTDYGTLMPQQDYATLVHFQGEGGARVYLETLKQTGDPNKAQQALNEDIKRRNGGVLPPNATVQEYLDKFHN